MQKKETGPHCKNGKKEGDRRRHYWKTNDPPCIHKIALKEERGYERRKDTVYETVFDVDSGKCNI